MNPSIKLSQIECQTRLRQFFSPALRQSKGLRASLFPTSWVFVTSPSLPFKIQYPEDLPVSQRRAEILTAIRENQVVIICGDTGSGKTTQLPKMMLEELGDRPGRIGVTQPRRLAATSMAARVAEECGVRLGGSVGVQVRFDNRSTPDTRIQFMTDGLLLAQLTDDPDWRRYSGLMIDEAHERSLNIDFILGCLKNLLPRRPDLKVVISSATLDAERFSTFFHGAPVLQVEGRLFPIQDAFIPIEPERDLSIPDQVHEALQHLDRNHGPLNTLIFLPGEREIRDCAQKLKGRYQHTAEILPLFARLGTKEQQRVFSASHQRRIVLATNVAETSLTIPGIQAVIDTGKVRVQRFHPQTRIQRLVTEQISQASARQRRGRCGRTGPGICLRLYSEEELLKAGEFQDPEIRRCSLAEVILRMAVMGLPPIQIFPFIDPPKGPAVSEGYRTLFDIGAMTEKRQLTKRGRLLATFSLEPRLARMLEEAHAEKVLPAVLVCAAFLSIQDPRERPAEKTEEADRAHATWKDPASDFMGVLGMWNAVCQASVSRSRRNRFCRQHYLHPRRVEEWLNLVDDLRQTCREHRWEVPGSIGELEVLDPDAVHRSLLAGIPRSVGMRGENQIYLGPGGQHFRIFPGSALAKKPPGWVMTFILLETTQLFARENAGMDPLWIEQVAGHLCHYRYERPAWNNQRGFVEAEERVTLGQLCLRAGTKVHLGRIDPETARNIFIKDALVPGKCQVRHPAFKKYVGLLASLEVWERKLRRPDYFKGSNAFHAYFDQLLPGGLCTTRAFEKWLAENTWTPSLSEILGETSLEPDGYPDEIEIMGIKVNIRYACTPASPEEDGIHFRVNEQDLISLPDEMLEWTIPAWLQEKVEGLIRSLDKPLRIRCNPVRTCAAEAIAWFRAHDFIYTHSLHGALAAFLAKRLNCILAAGDLNPSALPGYLRSKIEVIGPDGRVCYHGEHFPGPRALPPPRPASAPAGAFPWMRRWESWPDMHIPETVELKGQRFWPALCPEGTACGVKLYPDADSARAAWVSGGVRLYKLQETDRIRYLQKQLPLPTHLQLELSLLPAKGENGLEDLIDAVVTEALDLAAHPPANAQEFQLRCERARAELFDIAARMTNEVAGVFKLRSEVMQACNDLPAEHLRQDIQLQETMLWTPGWCADPVCLQRYPRYLKGMLLRIARARQDMEKDRKKMEQMEPLLTRLSSCAARLSPTQLKEAFLKTEEMRLAVFAPECRAHEKMSLKRFEQWLSDLHLVQNR